MASPGLAVWIDPSMSANTFTTATRSYRSTTVALAPWAATAIASSSLRTRAVTLTVRQSSARTWDPTNPELPVSATFICFYLRIRARLIRRTSSAIQLEAELSRALTVLCQPGNDTDDAQAYASFLALASN